eukprot:1109366-Pleurochrysis_carterae.AAC.1
MLAPDCERTPPQHAQHASARSGRARRVCPPQRVGGSGRRAARASAASSETLSAVTRRASTRPQERTRRGQSGRQCIANEAGPLRGRGRFAPAGATRPYPSGRLRT